MMKPCLFFWIENEKWWWSFAQLFGLRTNKIGEASPTFLNWEREIMMEPCLHLYNEQEYFWWSTRNIFDLTQANELDEVEDSLAKTENKWSKDIMLTRHARKIKVRLSTGYVFSSLFWTILENIQQLVLLH